MEVFEQAVGEIIQDNAIESWMKVKASAQKMIETDDEARPLIDQAEEKWKQMRNMRHEDNLYHLNKAYTEMGEAAKKLANDNAVKQLYKQAFQFRADVLALEGKMIEMVYVDTKGNLYKISNEQLFENIEFRYDSNLKVSGSVRFKNKFLASEAEKANSGIEKININADIQNFYKERLKNKLLSQSNIGISKGIINEAYASFALSIKADEAVSYHQAYIGMRSALTEVDTLSGALSADIFIDDTGYEVKSLTASLPGIQGLINLAKDIVKANINEEMRQAVEKQKAILKKRSGSFFTNTRDETIKKIMKIIQQS